MEKVNVSLIYKSMKKPVIREIVGVEQDEIFENLVFDLEKEGMLNISLEKIIIKEKEYEINPVMIQCYHEAYEKYIDFVQEFCNYHLGNKC